ncbi:hypothetical protein AB0910_14490 [Streptomyces sp. NPDC047002]|uniref:hypothetical protein n=1 Tax=Streptomyces sp. NPDC047002 TaxID=3155475 RepID=UPI0034553E46
MPEAGRDTGTEGALTTLTLSALVGALVAAVVSGAVLRRRATRPRRARTRPPALRAERDTRLRTARHHAGS